MGSGDTRTRVSVVIPACQEAEALPRCLASLLAQDLRGIELHVVVSVNGPDDGTAAAARSAATDFAAGGHRLEVVSSPIRSKALALDAADLAARDAFPRIYLDADVRLGPGAVRRTVEVLDATVRPRLAAPAIRVAPSRSLAGRHYGKVWADLPSVRTQVIGAGLYAVNRAGRARWGGFPAHLGCDDKFVRLHFAGGEAVVVDDTWFEVYLPERLAELVAVRGRWTTLNRDLARHRPDLVARDAPRWRTSVRHILGRPATWPAVPLFLVVWFGGWLTAVGPAGRSQPWARASSSPIRTGAVDVAFDVGGRPRVDR